MLKVRNRLRALIRHAERESQVRVRFRAARVERQRALERRNRVLRFVRREQCQAQPADRRNVRAIQRNRFLLFRDRVGWRVEIQTQNLAIFKMAEIKVRFERHRLFPLVERVLFLSLQRIDPRLRAMRFRARRRELQRGVRRGLRIHRSPREQVRFGDIRARVHVALVELHCFLARRNRIGYLPIPRERAAELCLRVGIARGALNGLLRFGKRVGGHSFERECARPAHERRGVRRRELCRVLVLRNRDVNLALRQKLIALREQHGDVWRPAGDSDWRARCRR